MQKSKQVNEFGCIGITKKTSIDIIKKLSEKCDQCGHCCNFDSGFLTDDDITTIAKKLNITTTELKKQYLEQMERFNTKRFRPRLNRTGRPYGKCVFVKKNLCSIHDVKPTGCRVGTCKEHGEHIAVWTALNYFVNEKDPESVRKYAQYLEQKPTIPGGTLTEIVGDPNRLKKILNYEILR